MHRQKFSRWLACKRKSPYVLAHMPPEEVVVDESQLDPKYKFYRMDPEYWKADQRKVNAIKNGAIAAKTKVSQLRGVGSDGKPHSFKFALELFNNHVLRYVGKDGKIKEKEMRRGNSSSSTRAPKTTVRGLPIIVVPNILTGCISSYNAMDFLGKDAKWISIADKKKSGGNGISIREGSRFRLESGSSNLSITSSGSDALEVRSSYVKLDKGSNNLTISSTSSGDFDITNRSFSTLEIVDHTFTNIEVRDASNLIINSDATITNLTCTSTSNILKSGTVTNAGACSNAQ